MADRQGEAAKGTSGQVSLNENGCPPNADKSGATGEAGLFFLKGKIFPASLKKRKYFNLFWLGAMIVFIEGISFIYNVKNLLKFWRRYLSENLI